MCIRDRLDLALAGTPCELLLNPAKGSRVDNGRVTILYIVFRAFAVIYSDLFADAVGDVGLVDDGIALVLFVGENGLYAPKASALPTALHPDSY